MPNKIQKLSDWRPKSIGKIFASREFQLIGKRKKKKVLLEIGRPRRIEFKRLDNPWVCPYLIHGIEKKETFAFGIGIDSIQALILALDSANSHLKYLARAADCEIQYLGPEMQLIFEIWDEKDLEKAKRKQSRKNKSALLEMGIEKKAV